jgi:hypothetical protein
LGNSRKAVATPLPRQLREARWSVLGIWIRLLVMLKGLKRAGRERRRRRRGAGSMNKLEREEARDLWEVRDAGEGCCVRAFLEKRGKGLGDAEAD